MALFAPHLLMFLLCPRQFFIWRHTQPICLLSAHALPAPPFSRLNTRLGVVARARPMAARPLPPRPDGICICLRAPLSPVFNDGDDDATNIFRSKKQHNTPRPQHNTLPSAARTHHTPAPPPSVLLIKQHPRRLAILLRKERTGAPHTQHPPTHNTPHTTPHPTNNTPAHFPFASERRHTAERRRVAVKNNLNSSPPPLPPNQFLLLHLYTPLLPNDVRRHIYECERSFFLSLRAALCQRPTPPCTPPRPRFLQRTPVVERAAPLSFPPGVHNCNAPGKKL